MCSSSGVQNCITQHLVSSHWNKSSTCFEHHVLVIRRSELYCTASGIVTLKQFLYLFRALCAHHQEVRIVLYSVWYRHTGTSPLHVSSTMCWSSVGQNCITQHLVSSQWNKSCTCFEHYVLIIRKSELYCTASGIVTLKQVLYMFRALCALHHEVRIVLYSVWYRHTETSPLHVSSTICSSSGGQNCIVQRLVSSHWCDDTRCCIGQIKFWPPDDEHIVLETCRGI